MPGIFDTVTLRQCVVALCLTVGAIGAHAAVLDRVDVVTRSSDAQIVVRFGTRISYLRHVPHSNGKEVRVFLRLLDFPQPESGLTQETVKAPRTDRVPDITVQYPEVNEAMLVSFSLATRFYVRAGEDGRSIVLTVPLLTVEGKTAPPQPAPAPVQRAPVEPPVATGTPQPARPGAASAAPLTPDEVEERARALIYGAREALRAKTPALAISRLNRILALPRNKQTEPAQALIGEARELNGEIDKARAEYELYLRLFPDGPALVRVSERLAALPSGAQASRAKRPLPKEAGPAEWSYNGSLSTYFYLGKSQIETLVAPPPGQLSFNRDTLSAVDQRSLITSLNLNARRRDAFTDTRIVFRNTDNHNFLRPTRSYNRVYSAYVDHVDRNRGYNVRLGRQNPNGIGVLERFDGLQAGYNLNDTWRVNGVYGSAVEFTSPFDKSFHGLSLEYVPKLGKPGVSAYAIEQTIDGHLNRRAVGSEVRYFDGRATAYGMLDYDLLYGGVNIALVQGNYLDAAGNNYFFVIDHRRAPSFGLTNALPGGQGLSLSEMISAQGVDTVRREAVSLTAVSDMLSFGVTRKLSENWQLGVDYRMSEISGTAPVEAVIPLSVIGTCLGAIDTVNNNCILSTGAFQGSGKSHALTFQAIGSNLWFPGAVGVSNLSFIFAPTFRGQALSLAYLAPIGTQWRIDTNLRYYRQSDDSGASQTRLSPSIKVSWHWRDRVYLEGEIGEEIWRSDSADRQDRTNRAYLYTGLRWDFR